MSLYTKRIQGYLRKVSQTFKFYILYFGLATAYGRQQGCLRYCLLIYHIVTLLHCHKQFVYEKNNPRGEHRVLIVFLLILRIHMECTLDILACQKNAQWGGGEMSDGHISKAALQPKKIQLSALSAFLLLADQAHLRVDETLDLFEDGGLIVE